MKSSDLKKRINDYLVDNASTTFANADPETIYIALGTIMNAALERRRRRFNRALLSRGQKNEKQKKIYYISMEFLPGPSMKTHLASLGWTEAAEEVLREKGYSPEDIYAREPDPGLGNGGLGRLASAYLNALTGQGYDATGFCIRYEYGLFRQKLIDGWQAELPDSWIPKARMWLNEHPEDTFRVCFYGTYSEEEEKGRTVPVLTGAECVEAIPYDMHISAPYSKAVNTLRLWRAVNRQSFDMTLFHNGDFTRAAQVENRAETISKVLYPADNIEEGKELRLKQQYFMVSASCQNILTDYYRMHKSFTRLPDHIAIHINDTHPVLCIPELMRILLDDYGLTWDDAWDKVTRTLSYTNHTVLQEALERWDQSLVQRMLPRIYAIIREIDRRFRMEMKKTGTVTADEIQAMAPLSGGQVRMAELALIGCRKINGVSALHSKILQDTLFHPFYVLRPHAFTNVTNGIEYRRWLPQANPDLASVVDACIGNGWRKSACKLADFSTFSSDPTVIRQVRDVKQKNKKSLSDKIRRYTGRAIDPESIYIVQAKRLHEYKRQLLNALRIISRYLDIKNKVDTGSQTETYLFAAKTAPNYYLAKQVIQLIYKLGQEIDKDKAVRDRLQVVFLENYSVSMAESLMPATDVSEQISLAGKEASGTGNMKMMINGALTVGTYDGANIEMAKALDNKDIFIFGLRSDEVRQKLQEGYEARSFYRQSEKIREVVDRLMLGFDGMSFRHIYDYLLKPGYSIADPYMCLADFESYCRIHEEAGKVYQDQALWTSKAIRNIAASSYFAADRAVNEYAQKIWETDPVL